MTDSVRLEEGFTPVSERLATARLMVGIPMMGSLTIIFGVLAVIAHGFWMALFIILAVLSALSIVWILWLVPRQVKLTGWKETETELRIVRGKMWHTETVIPFGRIQFVDVDQGPIARLNGIAVLRLNTASPDSDTDLPGLEKPVADALKERMARKAREQMSGL